MVGHNVWIGYQAIVMPGVRIGNGAIIGSGSVVTGDIPDYGVAGGDPATLIRRRYSVRRRPPADPGLVGLATPAHHRTHSHHHRRQSRRP